MKLSTLTTIVLVALCGAASGQTKYGVTATADKKTTFSLLKTYVWSSGHAAFDKTVDQQIVTAIDRELAALGFTKKAAGPADVLVNYDSVQRTDVDLKAPNAKDGMRPMYPVGTLVVRLLAPDDRRELFRVRIDKPLDVDRAQLRDTIDQAVAAMFEKYPTRQPSGR